MSKYCLKQTICILIILSASAGYAGEWGYLGPDVVVHEIELSNGLLIAGTDDGVYAYDTEAQSPAWMLLGLPGQTVQSMTVIGTDTILAGLSTGDIPIYRSTDRGYSWHPWSANWGGGESQPVLAIDHSPSDHQLLVATGWAVIARSADGGENWTPVWNDWDWAGMGIVFVEPDPYTPGTWWAGGEAAAFAPWLFKSVDDGLTWDFHPIFTAGDNRCHDVCIYPRKSNTIWVSMEGWVQRIVDGEPEVQLSNPYYQYSIEIDTLRPLILYSSGGESGAQMAIFKTIDGGQSWAEIVHPTASQNAFLDMILEVSPDSNLFYLASLDGVYTFVDKDLTTNCCPGLTGNVDLDPADTRDLNDILMMASHAFLGGPPIPCRAQGNVDGDPACLIDLNDVLQLAHFAYLGGEEPAVCIGACD